MASRPWLRHMDATIGIGGKNRVELGGAWGVVARLVKFHHRAGRSMRFVVLQDSWEYMGRL